jgi:hypothetical protein
MPVHQPPPLQAPFDEQKVTWQRPPLVQALTPAGQPRSGRPLVVQSGSGAPQPQEQARPLA